MNLPIKKPILFLIAAIFSAAGSVAFAEGPSIINVNPQGTVTNRSVSITLDTEDLAKCRYSTTDISYGSMAGNFDTPDGLYHSAALGTLNDGSYTYYVRCKDFDGNENDASKQVKFKVGNITGIDSGGDGTGDANAPALSSLVPSGTVYSSYNILSVTTSEAADCRYSSFNKAYDAMTLYFTSANKLYHTAPVALPNGGYYTYYVRCKDADGNINPTAGTITFRYIAPYVAPVTPVTPKDTTAPSISDALPTGDVTTETTKISVATNEAATCKYDTSDVSYDSMSSTLESDSAKTAHSKEVTLTTAGSVIYYVRCSDKTGNINDTSTEISFNYAPPKKEGPVISNLQPTGTIYQKNVALIAQTDKPADCRYSTTDGEFDSMLDTFSTNDGQLQQATVTLNDYGSYTYYVRCSDKEGNKDEQSAIINFTYENPNPTAPETTAPLTSGTPAAPVTCSEYKTGTKDGVCDKTVDCLCDPDCPATGEDADPDCANVVKTSSGNSWIVVVLIGLVIVIVIILAIVIMKRRSGEEETVELP